MLRDAKELAALADLPEIEVEDSLAESHARLLSLLKKLEWFDGNFRPVGWPHPANVRAAIAAAEKLEAK